MAAAPLQYEFNDNEFAFSLLLSGYPMGTTSSAIDLTSLGIPHVVYIVRTETPNAADKFYLLGHEDAGLRPRLCNCRADGTRKAVYAGSMANTNGAQVTSYFVDETVATFRFVALQVDQNPEIAPPPYPYPGNPGGANAAPHMLAGNDLSLFLSGSGSGSCADLDNFIALYSPFPSTLSLAPLGLVLQRHKYSSVTTVGDVSNYTELPDRAEFRLVNRLSGRPIQVKQWKEDGSQTSHSGPPIQNDMRVRVFGIPCKTENSEEPFLRASRILPVTDVNELDAHSTAKKRKENVQRVVTRRDEVEAADTPDQKFEMAASVKREDEMLTTESGESAGHDVVKKEAEMGDVVAAFAVLSAPFSPAVVMRDEEGAEASASGRQDQLVVKKEQVDGSADSPPAGLPAQIDPQSSHESAEKTGQQLIPFRIEWYDNCETNSAIFCLSRKLSGWPNVWVTRIVKKRPERFKFVLVTDQPVPDPRRFRVMNGSTENAALIWIENVSRAAEAKPISKYACDDGFLIFNFVAVHDPALF